MRWGHICMINNHFIKYWSVSQAFQKNTKCIHSYYKKNLDKAFLCTVMPWVIWEELPLHKKNCSSQVLSLHRDQTKLDFLCQWVYSFDVGEVGWMRHSSKTPQSWQYREYRCGIVNICRNDKYLYFNCRNAIYTGCYWSRGCPGPSWALWVGYH